MEQNSPTSSYIDSISIATAIPSATNPSTASVTASTTTRNNNHTLHRQVHPTTTTARRNGFDISSYFCFATSLKEDITDQLFSDDSIAEEVSARADLIAAIERHLNHRDDRFVDWSTHHQSLLAKLDFQLQQSQQNLRSDFAALRSDHSNGLTALRSDVSLQLSSMKQQIILAIQQQLEQQHTQIIDKLIQENNRLNAEISHLSAQKQEADDALQEYTRFQEQCVTKQSTLQSLAAAASHDTMISSSSQAPPVIAQWFSPATEIGGEEDVIESLREEVNRLQHQLEIRTANLEEETAARLNLEALHKAVTSKTESLMDQCSQQQQQLSRQMEVTEELRSEVAEKKSLLQRRNEDVQASYVRIAALQQQVQDLEGQLIQLQQERSNVLSTITDHIHTLSRHAIISPPPAAAEQRLAELASELQLMTESKLAAVNEIEIMKRTLNGFEIALQSKDQLLQNVQGSLLHQQELNQSLTQQHSDAVAAAQHHEEQLMILKAAEGDVHALQQRLLVQQQEHEQSIEEIKKNLRIENESAIIQLENKMNEDHQAALASAVRGYEIELKAKDNDLHLRHHQDNESRRIVEATVKEQLQQQHEFELRTALQKQKEESTVQMQKLQSERDEYLHNYKRERRRRREIHNQLQDILGNIRVMCRIRPALEVEEKSGLGTDVAEAINDEELLVQRESSVHRSRFEYDRVFSQTSTQEEVFEAVQPLCVSVLDGYNVCIFAYGQTGSGKTYTMEGYGENKGVTPRAIAELLKQVEQMQEQATYTLTLSMLEIYNETILDLLGGSNTKVKLDIRQTPDGNQVMGLSETEITSMEQVRELMAKGQKNRAVGSHDMNEHSSRSHSILTIVCRGKNHLDNTTSYGKLHLIDLAGSERISKTDATGERLKEAQNINKSLSALGDVINALGNKKAGHIPYRNSKLTYLLQDSLGGNSKVMTFVNISPAAYNRGETLCTLNFATRCRSTELGQAKKQVGEDVRINSSFSGGDVLSSPQFSLSSSHSASFEQMPYAAAAARRERRNSNALRQGSAAPAVLCSPASLNNSGNKKSVSLASSPEGSLNSTPLSNAAPSKAKALIRRSTGSEGKKT